MENEFGAHRAPLQLHSLRFAEKSAGIDIARKAAMRDPAKIIDPPRVRTVIKSGPSRPVRIGKTARRGRTVTCGLILFNGCAG